jgi:small subunit ribosomal protein S20
MANNASARKRIRQTEKRTLRNHARKTRMQRAVGKGVIHLNTVSRKLSRLSARIKGMAQA